MAYDEYGLFINLAPMGDASYTHQFAGIIDEVNHTPIPDAYAPMVFVALQFLASSRAWILA